MDQLCTILANQLSGYDTSSCHLWLSNQHDSLHKIDAGLLAPILNSLADGLLLTDQTGTLHIYNEAAVRMLGGNILQIGSPAWHEMFSAWHADRITPYARNNSPLNWVLRGDEVRATPVFLKTPSNPDGLLVELSGNPIRDNSNRTFGAVLLLRDLSSRQVEDKKLRQFETFVESTGDSIFSTTLDGTILTWNHGAEKMWGYSSGEVIGRNISELLPAEVFENANAMVKQRIPSGESIQEHRNWVQKKNGEWMFISATISPIQDASGKYNNVIVIAKDQTETKKAAEQIERDKQRFETLAHLVNDIVWEWDGREDRTWRHAVGGTFGYPEEKIYAGQDWWMDRIHPDDRGQMMHVFHQVMRCGQSAWTAEYRFQRADGTYAHVLDRGRVVGTDNTLRPNHLFGAMIDITERKETEQRLAQLAAIVESSTDGIVSMDLEGRVNSWNQGAKNLYGYETNEMIGACFASLQPEEAKDTLKHLLNRVIQGELVGRVEAWRTRKDGERILISETLSPMRSTDGTMVGICSIGRDITSKRLSDEKIKSLASDLARSNEDLKRFAHIASHDLREPLRTIISFARLLQTRSERSLGDDAKKYLGFVLDGASRMHSLVESLFKYSQVGHSEPLRDSVDCNEVLKAVRQDLRALLYEARGELHVSSLPRVKGDPTLLIQLFQNLISNAIKFRSQRPLRISISCIEKDGNQVFSIEDNGIGIPPEFHKEVFKVFRRLHSRQQYPGAGLGLAICQRILERHGGSIWTESGTEGGTRFVFTLPCHG